MTHNIPFCLSHQVIRPATLPLLSRITVRSEAALQITISQSASRRLQFTRTDFDDFIITLTAKLRLDEAADKILSGELQYPLIAFQRRHAAHLQQLNVPFFPPAALLQDPAQCYVNFLHILTQSLLAAPAPVPDVGNLNDLQEVTDIFRKGEHFIYSTIVITLKVGDSMHYDRQCQSVPARCCFN